LRAKDQCNRGTEQAAQTKFHGGMHESELVRQVTACREFSPFGVRESLSAGRRSGDREFLTTDFTDYTD
jgi:hypothetical protein